MTAEKVFWMWLETSYVPIFSVSDGGDRGIEYLIVFPSVSIDHEDKSMTNAKALLQSAWLGDIVSVKRCLVSLYIYYAIPQVHSTTAMVYVLYSLVPITWMSTVETVMASLHCYWLPRICHYLLKVRE